MIHLKKISPKFGPNEKKLCRARIKASGSTPSSKSINSLNNVATTLEISLLCYVVFGYMDNIHLNTTNRDIDRLERFQHP